MLFENKGMIIAGLKEDLGRSDFEAEGLEFLALELDIQHSIDNLKKWMQPTITSVPVFMAPASSEIHHEPYGVCLVIGAFNYPVQLALGPLVGAISAGNCCVVKPSDLAVKVEEILKHLIPKYLDNDCFECVIGGVSTSTKLLEQKWDKIFFTGSPRVGKVVSAAAAENLTPVTLELGGKSPVVVDSSVTDMALVTRRIMWGNCANAGQTCIAPDYVLCEEKIFDQFVESLKHTIGLFYGKSDEEVATSDHLGRVISKQHTERLKKLIDENKSYIAYGGKVNVAKKYVQPTIFTNPPASSRLLSEELFGPLLPVIKYKDISQVQKTVAQVGEKPLALYIFSKRRQFIDELVDTIQSGGVVVNDVMMHFGNNNLPFGGIGNSGVGFYHGQFSFECFSHKRAVMRRDDHTILDVPFRYPPYHDFGLKFFQFAARYIPSQPAVTTSSLTGAVVIAALIWYAGNHYG